MTVPLAVDFDSPGDFAIFILNILIATTTVIVAGSVVIAILCTKSLRTENRFIFMLNTSISDTLSGLTWCYTGIFDVREAYPMKNGTYSIAPALLGVNFVTILAAQVDRFFAVRSPFRYHRLITLPVTIAVCVYIWVHNYALVIVLNFLTSALAAKVNAGLTVTANISCIFIMIGLNIKLYLIAKYQLDRDPQNPEVESRKASVQLIVVVAACFLILWSPGLINTCLCSFTTVCFTARNAAVNPITILIRGNTIATPILYIVCSPALKGAVLTTVFKHCRKFKKR
ncbi:G-protein coupled receptor 183-like [Acipenser oxyrinchus oxyrinchus]|uniref:G-protein coupled receptor 183-like n=1 Tax=Acipenser oxyrinchus oxyrinchus TaxID=40147 RepID=A0AAD8D084_ACIOX|nr:G-protein coupled receptor 183-like [Acipenser oxyrinchus oxyrinchus]